MSNQHPRIERLEAVLQRTGLSRSVAYELIAAHEFVQPLRLSARRIGFLTSEVDSWIEARAAERPLRRAA